ncbi:MAG TPA: ATP-binding protein [Stellaceae bacterium]|nr:ATP-binding protein [Stellaceae bacterium]
MIEFVAGICLLAAVVFAALWWRARRRLRAEATGRAGLAALLGTAPFAAFCWRRDGSEAPAIGRLPGAEPGLSYAGFLAGLAAPDAARVAAAVDQLKGTGRAFTAAVSAAAGAAYAIEGCRTASGDSVLWLADASGISRAEEARGAATSEAAALRRMLDALPLPVWCRDRDLRLADCNSAYAAMRDMPRAAMLAPSRAPLPDDGRDGTLALARAAAASGETGRERRHVVIAGARCLLELTEAPDPAGGTIGFAIDHTDLERAENEMARHVNAHGQVLESIHAAVAIYGPDKRLNFFNSAFARLWDLDEEWLVGEPWLDELLERLRERRRVPEFVDFRVFKHQQLELFTSLIEPQTELMHLPDDRTLSVSVSPHPLGGLIFVYEDVTDRLALERSYNTLVEVERETLNNLFEGIAVFGSDGRLKLHNPAYRQIWGLSEADLADEPRLGEIVEKARGFLDGDGNWPALREQLIGRIAGQAHWRGRVDRPDGLVLQLATVPLPDGNVLFTCLDVTDSEQVARALRERNEALEAAGQLKSEFIANVSYELRTPLNAIIGFAEILTNQYFGPLSPRQLDHSRSILESSHQLRALINDILDLATIEAGYMALETGPVDVRDMLDAVLTLSREHARSRDLALTLVCPAEIGTIEADERRLKQALFNLVSNAIKFTPSGGSVRLEARLDNGAVVLAVADTGVGIPAADRQRVFESFERGRRTPRETGAGLGLSLVKSLVELHGGSIEIESETGRGTTVLCRLPAALRLPAAAMAASRPAI